MLNFYSSAEIQFELIDEIGEEGKNSKVYRAHDPQLDAKIVVKKIEKSKLLNTGEYFSESRLLHLGSHSNVVSIHYACQDDDYVYLAMPYYVNGSLKTLMAKQWLTAREIIVLGTQFLSGLHHIHSKRLIHFDIKPDNILISDRGEALISDFGLAKQMKFNGLADQDRMYGKMAPPEAFSTDEFSNKFDIYQVGLTLYRMSAGDQSFYQQYNEYIENGQLNRDRFRYAIRNGKFPDRKLLPEHIPSVLQTTINNCLKCDSTKRYSSILEVVNNLAKIDGNILDWRFEIHHQSKKWSKCVDGSTYELIVNEDCKSIATKRVGNGNTRKISDYCCESITSQEIKRFLQDH
jgi:eukaryotic-like serine/threonine-protein kinase